MTETRWSNGVMESWSDVRGSDGDKTGFKPNTPVLPSTDPDY